MSVLQCNRKGCKNIMCDRCSNEYGYICNECFIELINSRITNLKSFMKTEKPEYLKYAFDHVNFYNKIFPSIK